MTLAAEHLTLTRGRRAVVEGITTALEPGRITAIVGPNGAGKSSLLLALAGLLEPASGSVRLDGAPLTGLAPRARAQAIGYLPQTPDIAWDVSVAALVALGRLPWRDRGAQEIEAALAALDLGALRDRPVSRLSGGERARVLLARLLATRAPLLVADEPAAGLDPDAQLLALELLRGEAGRGVGVVVTLHDLALAARACDRVVVLASGRVASDGPPMAALSPGVLTEVFGLDGAWVDSARGPLLDARRSR